MWLAHGWQNELGEDESCVFAFSPNGDIPLGCGLAVSDAFVLDLSSDEWTAEQYTGGFDLHFTPGTVVRLVFWIEVDHLTDSGELAPGLGGTFTVNMEKVDEEGEN